LVDQLIDAFQITVLNFLRTVFGGFVLPTRQVPTQSRGGRKTKRIRGIEAESPKEKGSNDSEGRKLSYRSRRWREIAQQKKIGR